MSLSLDKAFGTQELALRLRAERSQLLASNIANADTPHYKAQDMDFQAAMRAAEGKQAQPLQATHAKHFAVSRGGGLAGDPQALYRVPHGPALDGNTVESHVEQARFAENSVQYQATLTFLGNRITGLLGAIRGE
ncbi:flagellar basal body rod protein FlgB [Alkalilimnicola ehrlichii MLHE-1]|uniref:Flagellar basal body rod protein FlgB n=1 Tax=Alkalilimnicola ehrlichii (strain ATCC BAA-1101 / DSM 17681 / MLHE-1) TaxID=187272 RepID=Q0AA90_ALKEH|nr:flagellar basal body rod protein FlgB [Alkalilimnicola ehrlichii]ABI56247.1 flagellar basal-body rod protein FlgB [Alkalilimnicola ehrlichii MLHE-1]